MNVLIKHEVMRDKHGMVTGVGRSRYSSTTAVTAVYDDGKRVRTASGDVWDVKPVQQSTHQFETVASRYN